MDGKWTHDKFAELETVAMDTGQTIDPHNVTP